MSVEELNSLHQRYIDLSARFKSAWTFHQFLQGLHKLLMDGEFSQSSADFQAVYGLLKEVSQNLNASETDRVRSELEMAERRLTELNRLLLQEDGKVSPSLLRLFFQRVKNYNDSIIVQLVKFYLYNFGSVDWSQDHNDKIDFLITKVAEEAQGPQGPWVLRSRSQMKQILDSLWELMGRQAGQTEIDQAGRTVGEFRRRMIEVDTFDRLIEPRLIHQYRECKLGLGDLFFHPTVLMAIVETNIELRNHIQQLYRREEQRIVADYQRIFELEREVTVDAELDVELTTFRQEVESFEKNLQNETLSLEELARLRQHVRDLIPRLHGLRDGEALFVPDQVLELGGAHALEEDPVAPSEDDETGARRLNWDEELLADYRRDLIGALEGVDEDIDPKKAVLSPELFPYRLEPREVVAYRNLTTDGVNCHRNLEEFVLWAAALRSRSMEENEEIRGILDDTAITKEAPVFLRARLTTRLADLFVSRFDHEISQAVTSGSFDTARELQLLRMRLMREYSGLWLQVHRN